MECLLDDFRAFDINADQWTNATQDEQEWRKTAEPGAEREMYRCRKSRGWTTACSSMPERDGKYRRQDSPKQACSCWFTRHS